MILDAHTPCPACPDQVRALYAVGRRVLAGSRSHFIAHERLAPAEYDELSLALDALRPFIEAHHANQVHAFSRELEGARNPQLTPPVRAEVDRRD